MSNLIKTKTIPSINKLYLSLFAINFVAGKPAEKPSNAKVENTKPSTEKPSNEKTEPEKTNDSSNNATNDDTSNNTTETNSLIPPPIDKRILCKPNTNSCDEGYSCIRFNKDNEYSCIKTEVAYCENDKYCKETLGSKYEHCYTPPWIKTDLKQCFEKQSIGSHCKSDIHCVNNLSCVNDVCTSSSGTSSLDDTSSLSENTSNGNILGINKWIFISAISFPAIVFILCMWCWCIGRSSSKHLENIKKARYEKELKENTIASYNNKDKVSSPTTSTYVNPQKEIEEEVGKRGFRSLFNKKKGEEKEEDIEGKKESERDISSSKVGGQPPINTSTTSDTQQKMKTNLSLVNLAEKNGAVRTRKNNGMKSPSTPASSVTSFANSTTSSKQGKVRTAKKKTGNATAGKKAKKASSTTNDATNSNSSKQSSQRGLINNASNMSSAISGQSASYFSSLDPQSALYYQQMYNAAAAQAAAQNQYYASYMQNPYYAAAAAQSAAYYGQDPNVMYNYQHQQGYQ
ncbi:hypothetical protein BCR36DRAFT_587698 [Piromyces finnis]|uniref:Uncharacterized protein n=1 Tax=Piromyces finnis TaxID=1754191 RepID=A0A1Y1UV59_9FUNG|nr:hypothetical protein BCR36DRAFT_587698 [Piromyces finnis]|eukprot:ORX41840.1 hypothetical protein BCR36DRAFT_587698 [Piromyces finnis]